MQRAKIISLALVVGFNLSRGLAQDAPTPNPRQTQEMLRETVNRAKADEAAKKANAQKAAKAEKKGKSGPKHDELFNLKEDPSETKDVSADHAAVVAQMKELLVHARDRGFTRPGVN